MNDFYLLIDNDIFGSYLLTQWLETFAGYSSFKGVILRDERPSEALVRQRQTLHTAYAGQTNITPELECQLKENYRTIDTIGNALIRLSGIPQVAPTSHLSTLFVGRNINGHLAKDWLKNTCQHSVPWVFSYVSQILKPWWIELTQGQIVNCHSAVLPYARGLNAIENITIQQEIALFRKACGITIHYIDIGVDTGPIIRAERIADPFRFNSIWELKAYSYILGSNLYAETAQGIINHPGICPAGIVPDPALRGPNFLSKDFTPDARKQAECAYLAMKRSMTSKG